MASYERDQIRFMFAAIRDLQERVTRLEQLDPPTEPPEEP